MKIHLDFMGLPNYYADPDGIVWSAKPHLRALCGRIHKSGYIDVEPSVNGKTSRPKVHRIVAIAFHGKPSDRVVRHLDGNMHNNDADNLRWGTVAENNMDMVKHGRNVRGSRCPCSKLREEFIPDIRSRLNRGELCKTIAADYGVTPSVIWHIGAGRAWKHV